MKIRWFTYIVLIYLLLASTWWTVLLFKKNEAEYEVKRELYALTNEKPISEVEEEYRRQKFMIIGECLFLGGTLLAGMWLIYRGHRKEVESITQQNNFLLAITHELKSPLSSIDLILQTLMTRSLEATKQKSLLSTSREELKRLEEMINNLLISAKDSDGVMTEYQFVRITELLLDIINQVRIEEPQIKLTFENSLESEALVKCDQEILGIAIKNVINNAIKYGQQKSIELELVRRNSKILLTISDLGPGISDKHKEKIFTKFYRVGDEMTRQQKGSGLGLFITKRIIDKHNGKIYVKNNRPTGSIFYIELPYQDE